MKHVIIDPQVPLALWVLLALLAAACLTWYAAASRGRLPRRRRAIVLGLMSLAVAIPLLVLLNPTWLERIPPPQGKPLLTILIDDSASMGSRDGNDADGSAEKTRYEVACDTAALAAARLSDRYEVRALLFSDGCRPVSVGELGKTTPRGSITDLAGSIEEALDDDRPQGQAVMLLSDGIHNAAVEQGRLMQSVAKAKAMAAPLYVKTIGGQAGVQDLQVSLNLPQELAFVGQQVPVVVKLRQRGSAALHTNLSLQLDGKPLDGEAAGGRRVQLTPDGTSEEVFTITQAKAGLYRYEIRADELPEEVTTVNNSATLLLRVVDQPVSVLLLEGKPYWDTKFLIRTLSSDRSVELVSIVRMAQGRLLKRKISHPAANPTDGPASTENDATAARTDSWSIETDPGAILRDRRSLDSYQVVVLGRGAEVFLTDEALVTLRKWLFDSDGSLVCFRGPPSSQINQRLGALMPLRWSPSSESRFRMEFTTAGRDLQWLPGGDGDGGGADPLSGMPSLATVSRVEKPKPLSVVLASAVSGDNKQPVPVITYQPMGNGRVVVVEGAGMWRWAFLPPQHKQHDELYGRLWRSLVRWLVSNVGLLPSQTVALRTDKVTFSTTETVTGTLLLREGQFEAGVPNVELTGGSLDVPRMVAPLPVGSTPGQFRVVFEGPLEEGRYKARVVAGGGDGSGGGGGDGVGHDEVSTVATFDVRGNLQERLDVRARPNLMKLVAQQSGGAVLHESDPEKLAEQFALQLSRSRPERLSRTTAWDRWWLLSGAFLLWGLAWSIRRRSGLV